MKKWLILVCALLLFWAPAALAEEGEAVPMEGVWDEEEELLRERMSQQRVRGAQTRSAPGAHAAPRMPQNQANATPSYMKMQGADKPAVSPYAKPAAPTMPQAPAAPKAPVAPQAPVMPKAPVAPQAPVIPQAPAMPKAPEAPQAPVSDADAASAPRRRRRPPTDASV